MPKWQIRDELSRCMHSEGGARIVFLAWLHPPSAPCTPLPCMHPEARLGGAPSLHHSLSSSRQPPVASPSYLGIYSGCMDPGNFTG